MRPKPIPPSQAEIDDDLAANLKAYGISAKSVGQPATSRERILSAYRELMTREKRLVSAVEVGNYLRICNARVSSIARALYLEGSMHRVLDRASGKVSYVPKQAKG